ncbi:MAG: S-adenosylhomocysteine hydrolase [Moraxellaceae bacterium]|nr:MAG: S-adenosylhomocysteine hydrolase [Moraxellaceae bacterium]
MTIKSRIQVRIKRAKRYVFMRQDFNDIADYDQIGRVLRTLVQEGELLKVGYGIYTKARKNQITGKIMPACPEGADAVILEALQRLDVKITLGDATEKYLSGESTQIPAFTQIQTPSRFKRHLCVGRSQING